MAPEESAHLRILKLIDQQPVISQRELASRLGVSLGKAHYLLQALLEKGMLKARNFKRSDNKMAYVYRLTPSGAAEKLRLARAYLVRKEAEYEAIKAELDALRAEMGTVLVSEESSLRAQGGNTNT